MPAPLVPGRESGRGVVNGFATVELAWCRDVEVGGPLGEFGVGHGPSRVRRLGLALIESIVKLLTTVPVGLSTWNPALSLPVRLPNVCPPDQPTALTP